MKYLKLGFSLLLFLSVCHGEDEACAELSCDRECRSHAWKLDSHGCPTCECWIDQCPKFKCRACPNYYNYREIEGHMCQGCECVDHVECPALECECMRSYKPGRDIDNCETCNCVPDDESRKCEPLKETCDYGYQMDENGCEVACNPVPDYCTKLKCNPDEVCRWADTGATCSCPPPDSDEPCYCPQPFQTMCVPR